MVEVLASLAVLVIGVVGLLVLASALVRQTQVLSEIDCGTFLARSRLAQIALDGIRAEGEQEGNFEEQGYGAFQWKVETKAVENTAGLYEVKVSVWKEGSQTVTRLVTIIREALR